MSAEGCSAAEWKGRALALLDALGQPDPKGPAEYLRWVATPSGEYVRVSVKLMPNGEARYYQEWFQVPKPVTCPTRSIGLLIVVLLLVFAAGAFAGRTLLVPDRAMTPGSVAGETGRPGRSNPNPAPADLRTENLNKQLASSRDVRTKLREYLSQEGFAPDSSTSVVDEKRSIKLIADLDRTPPPQETVRLSNIEVAKLVKLLERLDEWTTNSKAPPKSERR
jgi:hypothetical protein